MRESPKAPAAARPGSAVWRGALVVLAFLPAACAVQQRPRPAAGSVRPPASPMATVARLTAAIGEREPGEDVLKRGAEFEKTWRWYAQRQDASIVHGFRDHVQVSTPEGPTLACRFRDTPEVQVDESGGFTDYHLGVKVNCDNRQSYERYWNVSSSMNGADVMTPLRPVAARIAKLWYLMTLVPAEPPGSFQAQAQAYRDAATKPELPEAAREFKVRAETAVAEKLFFDAVEGFDRALQIAPWWPQGHFNVALVLGELKTYGLAVEEMERYLQLVPEAANARQAKDKIYYWRGKLEPAP